MSYPKWRSSIANLSRRKFFKFSKVLVSFIRESFYDPANHIVWGSNYSEDSHYPETIVTIPGH